MIVVPYTTKSGLRIGSAWQPPYMPPAMSRDAEMLQIGLLTKRKPGFLQRLCDWIGG